MFDDEFDYDYLDEKFDNAVDTLATGTGSIQSRLADAVMLNILLFKPEEIRAPIRGRFVALCDQLTANTDTTAGQGTLDATVNTLLDEEACKLANDIIEMQRYIKSQVSDS